MAQPWLRLYRGTVNNPKLQRLGLEVVGFWTNCLCLSDDDGRLPSVADIAWTMRLGETQVETFLATLQRNGLIVRVGNAGLRLHDWDDHQKSSDSSTDRVRKFRQKRQKLNEAHDETPCNVSETAQIRVDTDKNREEKIREAREQVRADPPEPQILAKPVLKKPSREVRGTRWPADAVVPDDWLGDGENARIEGQLPAIDLRAEATKFANYWAAKSGGGATKIDWKRTWINWALNAHGARNGQRISGKSQLEQLSDIARHGFAAARVID